MGELAHRKDSFSSAVLNFPLETQKSEENFDLALIASLEIDVVPYLGDSRVPGYLILQLGRMLHSGSQLQQPEDGYYPEVETPPVTGPGTTKLKSSNGKKSSNKESIPVKTDIGTTKSGKLVPRERFSYWCLDLLFLVCSDVAKGVVPPVPTLQSSNVPSDQETNRRRVASICLPLLLTRCRTTLVGYIADEELRGSLPFQR